MNCRRIQSLLSAYLDGELTGEEMIAIRHHISLCEFCSDEYSSLQIVKRLLGTLESVDASMEWSSTVTAAAYSGGRPWWEKTLQAEFLFVHFGQSSSEARLSPRGVRMVRALALSTVFVFLAAVPLSNIEHLDQGVTGRIAGVGGTFLPWTESQVSGLPASSSVFQQDQDTKYMSVDMPIMEPDQRGAVESASMLPNFVQPGWGPNSALTFVSTAHK